MGTGGGTGLKEVARNVVPLLPWLRWLGDGPDPDGSSSSSSSFSGEDKEEGRGKRLRVPHRFQLGQVGCGLYSLGSVLDYWVMRSVESSMESVESVGRQKHESMDKDKGVGGKGEEGGKGGKGENGEASSFVAMTALVKNMDVLVGDRGHTAAEAVMQAGRARAEEAEEAGKNMKTEAVTGASNSILAAAAAEAMRLRHYATDLLPPDRFACHRGSTGNGGANGDATGGADGANRGVSQRLLNVCESVVGGTRYGETYACEYLAEVARYYGYRARVHRPYPKTTVSVETVSTLPGGGETKGEDTLPLPHPSASSTARPVKTLPRPAYDGGKLALIKVCNYGGSGDVDKARDLIARGINIDELDKYGYTALVYAVQNNLEMVQEVIRAGAALDLQEYRGRTALMYAAQNNRLEMVQELIRAGAALDVRDNRGKTALQIARSRGYTKMATLLEEAEAAAAEAVLANEKDECTG